jgi:hypothetical protein
MVWVSENKKPQGVFLGVSDTFHPGGSKIHPGGFYAYGRLLPRRTGLKKTKKAAKAPKTGTTTLASAKFERQTFCHNFLPHIFFPFIIPISVPCQPKLALTHPEVPLEVKPVESGLSVPFPGPDAQSSGNSWKKWHLSGIVDTCTGTSLR